ncbi:hypothetical protein L3C95_02540 [Chitinophaga filiformis]|uniref:hypothetical protein n=1 Tax=Chitinophaga filiformis TaxID=104663 RepID=UPI001F45F3C7|nr:hypothetical protein [Chitinophaga filiformis]MCF6401733.1 hypothetical protein [Chitinophaga filiformis]
MIKKIQARPYHLLLLIAIIVFAASFCFYYDQIDIHLHDTYFVIPVPFIFWVFTLFLLLLWGLYHLTFRFLLSNGLIWLHMVSVFIFVPLTMYIYEVLPLYSFATPYEFSTWEGVQRLWHIQALIAMTFGGLQILYLFNLVGGVIKIVVKSK